MIFFCKPKPYFCHINEIVFRFFVLLIFISCDNSSEDCCVNPLRDVVIIDKGIYKVSYNEIHQQPNWIEYDVSNRPKNVDRGNRDFYLEPGVITFR